MVLQETIGYLYIYIYWEFVEWPENVLKDQGGVIFPEVSSGICFYKKKYRRSSKVNCWRSLPTSTHESRNCGKKVTGYLFVFPWCFCSTSLICWCSEGTVAGLPHEHDLKRGDPVFGSAVVTFWGVQKPVHRCPTKPTEKMVKVWGKSFRFRSFQISQRIHEF